jgi:hypothetical protein
MGVAYSVKIIMVPRAGVEPTTLSLGRICSIQLSYRGIVTIVPYPAVCGTLCYTLLMATQTTSRAPLLTLGLGLGVLSLALLLTGGLLFFFPQIAVFFAGLALISSLAGIVFGIIAARRPGRSRGERSLDIIGVVFGALTLTIISIVAFQFI